jgi:SAM-dependent methyltransferase
MSDYEWGERWDMACALPPNPKAVLDVGCGSGMDFLSLVKRGITVVGVDIDRMAIEKARPRLSEVRFMDVERDEWPAEWHARFDVVAFCDSLEHMGDPWRVLRSVRPLIRPGGRVVVSLPNIRQWRVVIKLVAGIWRYTEGPGIMNRGHLRFFTRRTIADLFSAAGYRRPVFYFPRRTFHLSPPERVVNALTFGLMADLLYASYTASAEPVA